MKSSPFHKKSLKKALSISSSSQQMPLLIKQYTITHINQTKARREDMWSNHHQNKRRPRNARMPYIQTNGWFVFIWFAHCFVAAGARYTAMHWFDSDTCAFPCRCYTFLRMNSTIRIELSLRRGPHEPCTVRAASLQNKPSQLGLFVNNSLLF